ncbi:glycoside hydrolase family 2 TIM barrel-domain containing protein [Deinococcus rubellus]|uniref:Glycoside hydrolase family 2 n=1 Tax=Deinococcus rubellus TaxID=1889240 RepID=A0ABY5YLL5_9DEIO|nr:glycoside hydrolase family 2 TIM barrel-domain containing protein [Deinococcus rubellus]UWX64992.1 glycoside hydrolase family 2 [Deinococcus rubellus]
MTYPRPLLRRAHWRALDGAWQLAFSGSPDPQKVNFDQTVQVPYAPESPRSGVHDLGLHPVVWYQQTFTLSGDDLPSAGEQLLLHFGAVDWEARVWANGHFLGEHRGGYTPFTFDVTPALSGQALTEQTLTITVRASDDPHDLAQPRGKQDWQASGQGHGIWYPRTSGIWQTVWLERVPAARLSHLCWTPDVADFSLRLDAEVTPQETGAQLRVTLRCGEEVLMRDTYGLNGPALSRVLRLPDPGIDDARAVYLWSPEHPQLLDATLEVLSAEGEVLDEVHSYTALRSVGSAAGRFLLNGHPYPLRLALDQGYWLEGGMTATDDEYRADVELAKKLGFNGVRKHQKIESPQWLTWCDRLGLLVWEELPSVYAYSPHGIERLTQTWLEVLRRDASHPCIVVWVVFNESWGVPDLPLRAEQRALVQSFYSLTRSLDTSRLVIGNDGWEHVVSDLLTIHDYTDDPQKLLERYGDSQAVARSLHSFRSAGRALTLPEFTNLTAPAVLSEFGGVAYRSGGKKQPGWGYSEAPNAKAFLTHYAALMKAVHACQGLAGFCYTQLTDTYQEINGLTRMDRTPKADLAKLAAATLGHARKPHNPLGYSSSWLRLHVADGELGSDAEDERFSLGEHLTDEPVQ